MIPRHHTAWHYSLFLFVLALCSTTLTSPLSAQGQDDGSAQVSEKTLLEIRAEDAVDVLNGDVDPQDLFSDSFLAQVSAEEFRTISRQLVQQFGAASAVLDLSTPDGPRSAIVIRMQRVIAKGSIGIGPDGKVNELLLQRFVPLNDNVAKIEADLAALPGTVSWWFGPLDSGKPILSHRPAAQMAIGSTFKLYVLATLAREVAQEKRSWSDPVTLPDTRSFPSGMMQDWPGNAPVTLMTLANLMISISDNTATDTLIDILGRKAIQRTIADSGHAEPSLNNPLMKTRDLFLLKAGPEQRLADFIKADPGERLSILNSVETPQLPAQRVQAAFAGGPVALDVEWFASAADLAALFAFMRDTADPAAFAIMAINSGAAEQTSEKWRYIGYKGGSEPGVLNFTWLVTDDTGRDHALILSWNNPQANVDESTLNRIAMRILAL